MAKKILVSIDGGHPDPAIARVVGSVARDTGATVRLLRVFPVPERVIGSRGTVSYVDQEMGRLTGQGIDQMRPVEAQLDHVPVEMVVRFGDSAREILLEAAAFDADLIAVAAERRGHIARSLRPDVADRVLTAAEVPVLLLRE